jgi:hypothetical protein
VTLDGILDRILDLLTTYTHDSELQAITAPPIHNSHITTTPAKPFAACCVNTSRSLVTVCNCGDSSASGLKSTLNGCFLPTVSFPHRLPYRNDLVAPIVFLTTPLHGPSRKHRFQKYLYCCIRIRCRGNVFTEPLPRISEPFASNGCFSRSTVLALSKYATVAFGNLSSWILGICSLHLTLTSSNLSLLCCCC